MEDTGSKKWSIVVVLMSIVLETNAHDVFDVSCSYVVVYFLALFFRYR